MSRTSESNAPQAKTLHDIAQIRPEHRYTPVGEYPYSTNDATDPTTSTRSQTRDEQKHGRTPASPYGRNGEEKLFYQRTRTADEAFTGIRTRRPKKSIKELEEDNAWFDHQLERSELEQTKLEKKVDELFKALDREKMAREDRRLSLNFLVDWVIRLKDEHELEVQELKEAGRQLGDENIGLRDEIFDTEKRCTMLYEMLVQQLQKRHRNKPAVLRKVLKNLHSALGDEVSAKGAA